MEQPILSGADQLLTGSRAAVQEPGRSHRSKAPVFVLGCPRSGTTVLYHMLLSAGGFAVYRAESNIFNLLSPRFGGLRSRSSREQCLRTWVRSKLFLVSGLESEEIRGKLLDNCNGPGDCMRVFMEEIARKQGMARWADCTPDHLLYMREIKREIPEALIIHIIRDGRDVALSYAQQGWSHPLPWDRHQGVGVAALYWSWVVGEGREHGGDLGQDYLEVRYENLVEKPRELLKQVSQFIDQDLDYDRIQQVGIGSVSAPNTSFGRDANGTFNPVGRWKNKTSGRELAMLESLIGERLQELGYEASENSRSSMRVRYMQTLYPKLFATKLWMKNHTPLGRLADTGPMEVSEGRP